MKRKLDIAGFWIRVLVAWAAVAALTTGVGVFSFDRSEGLSCGNLLRAQMVAAGVAAIVAPYLFSVYGRRLRDFGDGATPVWVLLGASTLYFALTILASSSCGPDGAFALPAYGLIANQLASWLGGLVSLGWTVLTLYAGLRQPASQSSSPQRG